MTMNIEATLARRRLILALGRGKSGKTLWARWLTEVMRARGVNPVVADADTVGTGLCRYEEGGALRLRRHVGAIGPWWDDVLADGEDRSGRPVLVDFSLDQGLILRDDPEGINFRDRYAEIGFDITKVFFFAPDRGDADAFVNTGASVTATDTLLVLNEGAPGEQGEHQFERVLAHPAVREAIEHGARVARMPALRSDVAGDIAGLIAFSKPGAPGREPLALQRQATRLWLGRMETAFCRSIVSSDSHERGGRRVLEVGKGETRWARAGCGRRRGPSLPSPLVAVLVALRPLRRTH